MSSEKTLNLVSLTTGELVAEVERRKLEMETREASRRKANEIEVVCPACGGRGQRKNYDNMRAGTGEAPDYFDCGLCNRVGHLTAQKWG